jgi:hypothetical protein
MTALSSKRSDWQTPPWLIELIRRSLGGKIWVDAASSVAANATVKADRFFDETANALAQRSWDCDLPYHVKRTLFLNPPGERSGKLVRRFWGKFAEEAPKFYAACWVGFNMDHLRFVTPAFTGCLLVAKKRIGYVNPDTGEEENQPQSGTFLYLTGGYTLKPFSPDDWNIWEV